MQMLRNSALALGLAATTMIPTAQAEMKYGFGNVSISRLDWSSDTEAKGHRDFTFLELEGGAAFSWGEMYGFIDLESPHRSSKRQVAMKGTMRTYLGNSGLNLYTHIYDLSSKPFSEQNRLIGLGFNLEHQNIFFKPFLAYNHTASTYFSGSNGAVFGWVAGINFSVLSQSLMVTNWNEYEFLRDSDYFKDTDGMNGAAALWWNANEQITLGLQYRYAYDKLGKDGYQDALVYTLKYNL